MISFEESEKIDPPSCLDAALERKAMFGGSVLRPLFRENDKYVRKNMIEDYIQGTDSHITQSFGAAEGTKHDTGKPRYELMPPEALAGTVRVLTFGAGKYGDRNFEKGIKYGRVFGAAMRHLWAWWRGEDNDPETGESHLHHAACCIVMLQTYVSRGMTDFDDRPK